MPEQTYIYGLLDPIDEKIHYVGKTCEPIKRYKSHLNTPNTYKAMLDPGPRESWITDLAEKGLKPKLVILETINCRESRWMNKDYTLWHEAEQRWIKRLTEEGHPLTNVRVTREPEQDEVLQEALKLGREMFG